MIQRFSLALIRKYSKQFRALAVVGPRQSGKTTLVRLAFPNKPYVSLENPDERMAAEKDPRAFLNRYKNGAIFDEAQRVPVLFNYLQQIIDESNKDGQFILTGSNNFLLQANISQSLAGRIGYIDLLPLTYEEITMFKRKNYTLEELLLKGGFPEVYDKNRDPLIWFPSYIRTYVERDVKQLRNIEDTLLFNHFMQLCAGRTGQLLSVASISNECGIDVRTVNAWLGILQSSYIIYLLPPHHKNFNKRVVKSPKLYFYDTGVACSLLGLKSKEEIALSHFKGALFENYVITEITKNHLNNGIHSKFYFWRDNNGTEIDLIIDGNGKLLPIEIKSSQTYNEEFTRSLRKWNNYSGNKGGILLYDGKLEMTTKEKIQVLNWKNFKPGKK